MIAPGRIKKRGGMAQMRLQAKNQVSPATQQKQRVCRSLQKEKMMEEKE